MTRSVISPAGPEALQREGLREMPEMWEDGLRAEPAPGNFEWWYFDFHFVDGSTAVVTFFTKSLLDRRSRLKPGVSVTVTRPDGKKLTGLDAAAPASFSASKDRCYVRVGESWVRGDLREYELHVRAGELSANLKLSGIAPAWRPGTGKNYYDEALTRYFAWLPSIPYGSAEGSLTYDGKLHQVKGDSYHDHNWGNVGLNEILSHWYWGRAHVGDYTLIFAEMHTTDAYGRQPVPVFMLSKGSQVLAGDAHPLRVVEGEFIADPGGRSYPDGLVLNWQKDGAKIQIKLSKPALIDSFSLLDLLPAWQRVIGRLLANPYYFRFNAGMDLQIDLDGLHDNLTGQALYELMLLR